VKTPRSAAHLAYVRALPCAWCGAHPPSEASHHGPHGVAIKGSDYAAIPLCSGCHAAHHSRGLPGAHMNRDQARAWFESQALLVCSFRLREIDHAF
jgi:hypothetical protein